MEQEKRHLPPRPIWAYGYEIAPPLTHDRLRTIKALLEAEHSSAKLGARTWEGRFVVEEQVTHILVVTDSPDQALEINRRLEAELKKLEAGFSISAPLAVVDHAPRPPPTGPQRGPPYWHQDT